MYLCECVLLFIEQSLCFVFFFCARAISTCYEWTKKELKTEQREKMKEEKETDSHFASGEYKQFKQHYWQISESGYSHMQDTGK